MLVLSAKYTVQGIEKFNFLFQNLIGRKSRNMLMPLFFERLCVLSRRVGENFKNNSKKLFATIPVALLITTPLSIPATLPEAVKLDVPKTDTAFTLPSLMLATNSPKVILISTSVSEIVPGESAHGRDIRLAAEAAAKAAAEAARRAKLTQTVKISTIADPADFDALYRGAGQAFGVDWQILKAIHQVETGASGSTTRSNPSGATGPMQFMPSTFRGHAVDGNGDGIKSVHNVSDAIYSAAKLLSDCNYPSNKDNAILKYNRSISYLNRIKNLARSYGLEV